MSVNIYIHIIVAIPHQLIWHRDELTLFCRTLQRQEPMRLHLQIPPRVETRQLTAHKLAPALHVCYDNQTSRQLSSDALSVTFSSP